MPLTESSIPPAPSPPQPSKSPPDLRRRKAQAASLSVALSSLLLAAKVVIGVTSGSVGVLSEAIHSGTDLIAACVALLSVRASDLPPDDKHPYGHGKIEGLSSLLESLLIFIAALFLIAEAGTRLRHPSGAVLPVTGGLVIMALSAVGNQILANHLMRIARETDSLALESDARHLRTDVLTSVGVFVGLLAVRLTGQTWLDPLVGVGVSLLILYAAFGLARNALNPLLDERLPQQEESLIHDVLQGEARVLGYHKLRTRKSGSQRHADVHVQIDDECSLLEAHDLTEELEDRIRAVLPAVYINIHVEPYHAELRHQAEAHGVAPPEPLAAPAPEPNVPDVSQAGDVRNEGATPNASVPTTSLTPHSSRRLS